MRKCWLVQTSLPKGKVKRRRSRALVLLLLPALIVFAFVGYVFCGLDFMRQNKRRPKQQQRKPAQRRGDAVTFMPNLPQDEQHPKIRH